MLLPLRSSLLLLPLVALVAAPFGSPVPLYAQADRTQVEMVKLTFPNADVRDVLTQYELLVGKHIIYDNTVQGQVNINVPEVPKEEAIRIIEITLLMNGYHLVPSDSDPNLIKVTGVGRSPRQVGVPILAEPEPIPDGEQVIMYLVKLQYADPTELAQVLQQAMPASRQEYAPNIVPLPKAQAIIITENTTILRGLMRIIRAADLEPTKVDGEFITLQRASAKDVVQMLEKLFEKPQSGSGSGASVPRPAAQPPAANGQPGAVPAAPTSQLTTVEIGGMTEDSMVSGKVRLTADERTNRIYVVSRPVNLPVIRKLIHDFDQDVPFNEPMVRPLKFVSAGDILDALVKAVSDPGTKDAGATGTAATPGQRAATPTPTPAQSPFGNSTNRGLNGSSSSAQGMTLQTEPREIIPQTVLVGNSRIMADKRRNAILVIGSTDMKEKVSDILDRLDVRTPQVMLTTVIGELTLSDGQDLGLTYLLHNGKREVLTGTTVSTGTSGTAGIVNTANNAMTLNLQQLLSDTRFTKALTGGAGGLGGFISVGDSLGALVTALESTTKFKVTSRPSLFTSNNKKASIISGERIAVITGTQSGLGTGSSLVQQNQVQYIDVNLSLEVVPLINSDKEVYLDVVQNLAEVTGQSLIGTDSYPIIANRQLQTAVMVPNEGTLVLGGLIKDRREKTTSGVPGLSRLPLLGGLFRTSSSKKQRTELVVLIRPSVSMGPDDAYDVRDRNMRPLKIPMNLEDDLILPEPTKKKDGKVEMKQFRADPTGVKPTEEVGPGTPKASAPENPPAAVEVKGPVSTQKKVSKPQTKVATE